MNDRYLRFTSKVVRRISLEEEILLTQGSEQITETILILSVIVPASAEPGHGKRWQIVIIITE